MKNKITVLTLGVDDLDRSLKFYRDGLGFQTEGIVGAEFEDGAVVFIRMDNQLILGLWPRSSLAKDANVEPMPPSATELSIGHNVESREEVDAVMEEARAAGAEITKEAADTFWGGYSGYFLDPDGHLWEVVFNPDWETG
jgi:catechol 2,3-dioxygenase-like lactoylglutathione lyase family enzyme